jgi:hypothetical protein
MKWNYAELNRIDDETFGQKESNSAELNHSRTE